jgi:hypothetical protein
MHCADFCVLRQKRRAAPKSADSWKNSVSREFPCVTLTGMNVYGHRKHDYKMKRRQMAENQLFLDETAMLEA